MSQTPKSKLQNGGADFTPTIHHEPYDYIKPEQFNLQGRSVLITGASKGIGRKTALSFARAGASQIAIAARSSLDSLKTEILEVAKASGRAAPKVLCLSLDVVSEENVADAAKQIRDTFRSLDILINNAGHLKEWTPVADTDPKDWWYTWEVNIKGPYLVTRALLPLMLESKGSLRTILNISSIGAHVLTPGASAYQSGKLALLRIGEFINMEYGNQGILCYSAHPGSVMTELASSLPTEFHELLKDKPELAADTFVWLTSEKREWLAGRYVSINWDMKQLLEKRAKIEEGDLLKVRMNVGLE